MIIKPLFLTMAGIPATHYLIPFDTSKLVMCPPILLCVLLFKQAQNFLDHLPVFQANGQEDGFHGPWIGHVDSGAGVHFGTVERAGECLLVFLAQSPPKWLQPFPLRFHDMAQWQAMFIDHSIEL